MGLKKLVLPLLVGVVALALVIPAAAQDATATPDASGAANATTQGAGTLSCDSSTILLAGLAERYFGYMPTGVTLSNYVYGQYSPLFDMSGVIAPAAPAAETTPDAASVAANPTLPPATVMLNSAVIAGEDPACTQLRTSLESFFSTKLQSPDWDMQFRSGMSGVGATG